MKRIYVVRHAKSSWADMSMTDRERPLNKRGNRDAPVMAEICKRRGYIPQLMISSIAQRAFETSQYFKSVLSISDDNYSIESKLYHAPEESYLEVCYGVNENLNAVMLFGHNPGVTNLANSVGQTYIDNVPTCGVLVIDVDVDQWTEMDLSRCALVDFIYPKMIS